MGPEEIIRRADLSLKESHVLVQLMKGMTADAAGVALNMAESTVRAYATKLYSIFLVSGHPQLIARLGAMGWFARPARGTPESLPTGRSEAI